MGSQYVTKPGKGHDLLRAPKDIVEGGLGVVFIGLSRICSSSGERS